MLRPWGRRLSAKLEELEATVARLKEQGERGHVAREGPGGAGQGDAWAAGLVKTAVSSETEPSEGNTDRA